MALVEVLAALCALVVAAIALWRTHGRGWPVALAIFAASLCALAGSQAAVLADDEAPPARTTEKREWKAPPNWPKDHPLPRVASNCAACHLTAGRELTAAVEHFVHSVHDMQEMSCADCHGGNREDDGQAHEEQFGFIGTKISAHIKTCSECHTEQADALAAGPHHWDFSTRVNLEYPTCVDCHGNHDIGNPPDDFKLLNMCLDCHDDTEAFPNLAEVVKHNDALVETLRGVRAKRTSETEPIPPDFHKSLADLRERTMTAVHGSKEITADAASALNGDVEKVRVQLEEWLKSNQ